MELNTDLSQRVAILSADLPWLPSPMAGVERRMLERQGEDGSERATSIVRYAAGSHFSPHTHRRGEEFIVLEGTFSDELGDYPAGAYVRNPPGSRHQPHSDGGTTIFVKLQQFQPGDDERVVIHTGGGDWRQSPETGSGEEISELPLHAFGTERARLLRLSPGARFARKTPPLGEEILVLEGILEDELGRYPRGAWLRTPPGPTPARSTAEGCLLLVKDGHLG